VVGEHVFLRVKLKKSYVKLGNCFKVLLRCCASFDLIERIRSVAYRFAIPPGVKMHVVFHVSFMKKYVLDPNLICDWSLI
jgi:hypothetical protein